MILAMEVRRVLVARQYLRSIEEDGFTGIVHFLGPAPLHNWTYSLLINSMAWLKKFEGPPGLSAQRPPSNLWGIL